jgi:hypothetical protein
MPEEAQSAVYDEIDREAQAFTAFVRQWPDYREHAACAILGAAIGLADVMGVDVEGYLAKLREMEPKPGIMRPPSAEHS